MFIEHQGHGFIAHIIYCTDGRDLCGHLRGSQSCHGDPPIVVNGKSAHCAMHIGTASYSSHVINHISATQRTESLFLMIEVASTLASLMASRQQSDKLGR